jgi:hypothetical protein
MDGADRMERHKREVFRMIQRRNEISDENLEVFLNEVGGDLSILLQMFR